MPWRWRLSKLEGRIGIWVRVTFLQRDRDQETEWLQCFLKMGGKYDRVQRAIHKITTGMLTIYASTIGAEIQRPFGGTHHMEEHPHRLQWQTPARGDEMLQYTNQRGVGGLSYRCLAGLPVPGTVVRQPVTLA